MQYVPNTSRHFKELTFLLHNAVSLNAHIVEKFYLLYDTDKFCKISTLM